MIKDACDARKLLVEFQSKVIVKDKFIAEERVNYMLGLIEAAAQDGQTWIHWHPECNQSVRDFVNAIMNKKGFTITPLGSGTQGVYYEYSWK